MTQQHDYVIENADGASVRNDINDVLLAIAKNNEGGSDPSTTYTFQFYMDTGDNIFKIRNSANNAYINLFGLGANSTTNVVTDVNQTFTKAQRGSLKTQNATTGGLITLDLADNNYFILSDNAGNGKLGNDNSGAYTLANPSNIVAGQSGSIFVIQPSAGGKQLGYEGQWHFAGGTAPTLSTTANAIDRIDYIVHTTTAIHSVATLDIKTTS